MARRSLLNFLTREATPLPFRTLRLQNAGTAYGTEKVYTAHSASFNSSAFYRNTSATGYDVVRESLQSTNVASNPEYASKRIEFNYEMIRNEILNHWLKAEASLPNGSNTTARYCCFTLHDGKQEYIKTSAKWHWLDKELSSNLAGETGAVYIYKGALSAMTMKPTSDDALDFCKSHMANELSHLRMFQNIIPSGKHTKLLYIWQMAGWTLGFFPTMIGGSRALFVTVEAVETFVEEHFQEQIVHLKKQDACPHLVQLLERCCEDEVHHKEDAAKHLLGLQQNHTEGQYDNVLSAWWVKPWSMMVRGGSALAATIARRI